MRPPAGQFNRRVQLQSRVVTYNEFNEPIQSWTGYANCWAKIKRTAGGETRSADKTTGDADTELTLRYRSDVSPEHRVSYGSRTMQIVSVIDEDERHENTMLRCREIVA